MYCRARSGLILALGAAALTLPATAAAATKTVYAGTPPTTKKLLVKLGATSLGQFQPNINAFVNQRTTIHTGDKVSFVLRGFHTIDLPKKGGGDVPLIVPSGGLVSGVNDAAGNPFWFNGKVPNLGFNPALFKGSGGTVYSGQARIDSGLPLGPPKPFLVKFTKAGTYKYYCDVHPGMIGYVTVKPKAARLPTAKQSAAAQVAQLTADIKAAVKAVKAKLPANTVSVGKAASGGVELFSMFPATLTVNTGTVVTFKMSRGSFENHTATFGPAAELKTLASTPPPALPAQEVFPSDPTQPVLETPTNHGDGFANTGVLDNDPSTATIPSSGKIQFNAPGTYHYICLIHPFMTGTIVVK
ncbi:MAG: hypothetical protein M3Y09_05340 [Actinomycetota bacterium]|nr:hypothetical protein [Actinomycetota bacterium]